MTSVPGGWAAEVGRDGAVVLGANAGCAKEVWSGITEQMDNINTQQAMAENRTLVRSNDILLHPTEEFLCCRFDHLEQVILSHNT